MLQTLIDRYKRMRSAAFLNHAYGGQYAFVGIGQHSLTNLYPVLHYLQVPLKYICVTSDEKARLVERKFRGVRAVSRLSEVLADSEVKGVFVAAAPRAHFQIARQVLESGKSLFVEKPPCLSLGDMEQLADLRRSAAAAVAMVGLQKRYAPAVRLLRKRLAAERPVSYDLHYRTGAYPEGDALTDLYIHPLDLVTHLFGKAEVVACQPLRDGSYLLMLRHEGISGTLELSTGYTWTDAEETLSVCTDRAVYEMRQLDTLTRTAKQRSVMGVPMEKVRPRAKTVEYLFERNNFTPVLANNQVFTQGYFDEINAFVEAVEGRRASVLSDVCDVLETFRLLNAVANR